MELLTKRKNITAVVTSTDVSPVQPNVQAANDFTIAELKLFNNYIITVVLAVLSPLLVTTDILSMVGYLNHGIRENVNITCIVLFLGDLLQSLLVFLTEICIIILQSYFPHSTIYLLSIQFVYLAHPRGCTRIISTILPFYLFVKTSIDILLPFKIKDIFTTPGVVLININYNPIWPGLLQPCLGNARFAVGDCSCP